MEEQELRIKAARELREHLLRDRYRPGYHFAIPEGIGKPGDPNGAFFANGRYHLMYLYNRIGPESEGGGFSWGHISSSDLVHWRHHPDAIFPGEGHGGCFSGGAFLDDDGTAYLSYWRLPPTGERTKGSGIGIARSVDRHYEKWQKLPIPSLDGVEPGIREVLDKDGEKLFMCNADPSNIWKKDGAYYMEAGNLVILNRFGREQDSPIEMRGDWVDLFRSKDLLDWDYVHRFYRRNQNNGWTQESEDDMCPSFLPLPASQNGGEMSGKYLQLFISHNMGCQYYIGEYDTHNDLFIPETHGRMSWVDNTFFAPEALIDGDGRQIMWAWLVDNPEQSNEADAQDGWSGVYGLPRVLWLGDDDTLRMAPAPELSALRYNNKAFPDVVLTGDSDHELRGINGESCEVTVKVDPGDSRKVGLVVRAGVANGEKTLLYYDAGQRELVFDATKSGGNGRRVVERAPYSPTGEVTLRVFVDKSVVEVFAEDRQAICRRVYPEKADSDRVLLFQEGGSAAFTGIETWEMMPSNGW